MLALMGDPTVGLLIVHRKTIVQINPCEDHENRAQHISLKTIGEYTIVYILSQKYSFSIFDCFPLFSRPLDNFPVKL